MTSVLDPPAPVRSFDGGARVRVGVELQGAVQGVGYRPHVYRLAQQEGMAGFVRNHAGGLRIEAEGAPAAVERFVQRLRDEQPPLALVTAMQVEPRPPCGDRAFVIEASAGGAPSALLLPDVALCPACRADVDAPHGRRRGYPFTNCTHCGPRFSIVRALPYDRAATTMAGFRLCLACAREYSDPGDRRFHAQPTACAACGPTLALLEWRDGWMQTAKADAALEAAAVALQAGKILALKGLGGFQLLVDAGDVAAVARLRARKGRPEKPLAVMAGSLEEAQTLVQLSADEAALLCSPAAPILLAPRRAGAPLAEGVAPGNARLGLLLPTTPLHHLLLRAVGRPLVATSGNRSDEPLCTENDEALARLGNPAAPVADLFLLHDRPIARHVDDSVVQWVAGAPQILRRARGYAPLPVALAGVGTDAPCMLAVGGHQKNTTALALGANVFLSQHIGDLESPEARATFACVVADFLQLYDAHPLLLAHDAHPDYASTAWARDGAALVAAGLPADLPTLAVQHHHAHLAACLADSDEPGPAIGVIWDGSGLGTDGTIWGGEFLVGDAAGCTRGAHLRPFALPGGEAAVREPWRPALALLYAAGGAELVERAGRELAGEGTRRVLTQLLAAPGVAPLTTSAGRLFDGCAALLGLRRHAGYEGQAALLLEQAADVTETGAYPLLLCEQGPGAPLQLDWAPMLHALLADRAAGVAPARIAARVHRGLAGAIATTAAALAEHTGVTLVPLSGGCFQNRLLAEWAQVALERSGLRVLHHRRTPCNDGGLALGQIMVARAHLAREA